MIRALLLRNLRHYRGLLLSICLGSLLFEMLIVWFAAQFERGPGIRRLVEEFLPVQVRLMFASQLEMLSFAGFVGFGFQHPFILVCTIALITVMASLPAGERESGFLDLLLARPLTRRRYLAAVWLLVLVGSLLVPLMVLAGAAAALSLMEVAGELPWPRYVPSALSLVTLLLAIGGYTLLIASISRRRGTAVSRAVGLTLLLFLLDVFADMWSPLRSVSWLSPFHYYDPLRAAVTRSVPLWHPLVLLAVGVATAAAAFLRFDRQDL